MGASCTGDLRMLHSIHAILFPHDAPDVAANILSSSIFDKGGMLDLDDLKKLLMVYLVDDKGKMDKLAKEVFCSPFIFARPWVVA